MLFRSYHTSVLQRQPRKDYRGIGLAENTIFHLIVRYVKPDDKVLYPQQADCCRTAR